MFWKKKEKFDRIQAYLDKVGVPVGAETMFDGITSPEIDLLNLCGKEGNPVAVFAQLTITDEFCYLYCDPETQSQKDMIEEICIETGIQFYVEKDVDMDLPEEERIPQKWSVTIPVKHWKKWACLFMRDVFDVEDFIPLIAS